MAFRKFGGIEYHKKNNYVSSNINNNMNLNITDQIGNINTKIVTKSHLDLDGQTMFNVGNVIFANGLDVEQLLGNVDLSNTVAIQSIFTSNNNWSGVNTFSTTVMSSATMTNASASNLQVGACQININGDIDASSLSVGSISGGAISGSSLSINGYGISSAGTITGNTLTISGTTGTIGGIPILTTAGLSGYASLTDTGPQSFAGNISTPSLSSGSIGITSTNYGISSAGTITGNTLTISGTTGTIGGIPILTTAGLSGYASLTDTGSQSFVGDISTPSLSSGSIGISGTTYGISSAGTITGSSVTATTGDVNISTGGLLVGTVDVNNGQYGINSAGVINCSSLLVNNSPITQDPFTPYSLGVTGITGGSNNFNGFYINGSNNSANVYFYYMNIIYYQTTSGETYIIPTGGNVAFNVTNSGGSGGDYAVYFILNTSNTIGALTNVSFKDSVTPNSIFIGYLNTSVTTSGYFILEVLGGINISTSNGNLLIELTIENAGAQWNSNYLYIFDFSLLPAILYS